MENNRTKKVWLPKNRDKSKDNEIFSQQKNNKNNDKKQTKKFNKVKVKELEYNLDSMADFPLIGKTK